MAESQLLSSTGFYGGMLDDLTEHIPELLWPMNVRVFGEMRTDAKLASVLKAYGLPIGRASWAVDPAGCRPEVVGLVADGLGLPVLGADATPGGARRRGVKWREHLRMAMLHLVFGHMPFELEVDAKGPRTTLVGLHERMPVTITDIRTDKTGGLVGITQDTAQTVNQNIPVDRLCWYVNDREGAAWQGRSLLRPAYAAWLIKREMLRVHATGNRRFSNGVPSVEAPPGATPAQVAEAQRLASSVNVGQMSGMGLPNGFVYKLTGLTGGTPDTLAFIRYLDQQMSGMALTGVLDLGDTPNGSRALGETFVDLLLLSLQSIAESVADTVTSDVAVRLVDWNWGDQEPAPRVVVGDVGSQHQVTAETLQALLTSGALSADPELEAYVRREWKLPGRDPNAPPVPKPVPVPVAAGAAPRSGRRVAAAAADGLRRELTTVEAAAKVDFPKLQGDWESALDQLVKDWDAIGSAQRDQLVTDIRAAAEVDDVAALSDLTVDSQAAAETLAEALHEAADAAAADAAAEADAQGVAVDLAKVTVDRDRLDQVAAVVARMLAVGLAAAAARKALAVWGPATAAAEVASQVGDHLALLTDAALRDALGGGLTVAQNAGRVAVLHEAPAAAMYAASEVLDTNTCGPCADIDGTEFANLAAAEDAYASGGFYGCDGGLRCRGVIVTIWDTAALDVAA